MRMTLPTVEDIACETDNLNKKLELTLNWFVCIVIFANNIRSTACCNASYAVSAAT